MDVIKDAYEDVEPVTLRLRDESVTSHLYTSLARGIDAHLSTLVEAYLIEVFRCRVCQFTSAQKARISSHVAERHSPPSPSPHLSCLEKEEEESLTADDNEAELDQNSSPYDLHSGSRTGEDHMDMERISFLLPMYGMLQNISPPPCDIGMSSNSDGNLHVVQTCEVSTLFEEDRHSEEENVYQLEDARDEIHRQLSTAISCTEEEEMAQSAHLMTLGLCRISSTKCPHPPATLNEPIIENNLEDKQPLLASSEMQKQAEEEMGISCDFCQVVLASHSLLEVHLKCHNGEQGFKCPRCDWTASEWADMESHWRSHGRKRTLKSHKCADCPRMFRRADLHDAHEKRHKLVRPKPCSLTQCSLCFEWCHSEQEREMHQQCHFQGGFKCLYCSFTEKSWKKMHKHIRNQHIQDEGEAEHQTSYSVEVQMLAAPSSKSLGGLQSTSWRHVRRMKMKHKVVGRKKRDEKKRDCVGLSEKEMNSKLKVPKKKEFCCTLCDKKFSTKLTMRRHMGIHQGDKPYECPHCHYCTRLKASLIQHLRVHTGEKPFKCSHCSYASIDRSSLRRHLRTHTQEKPYRCQYCPYSCIQKKSLDLHCRRHHTGESFPCPQCQYSTPDRQLLLRHTRKHHSSQNSVIFASTKRARHSK